MNVRLVTEVSCYMKNEPGMLGLVAQAFADAQINIIAIESTAGHLECLTRFIVDEAMAQTAEETLRSIGIEIITKNEVLEILFRSKIGFMAKICKKFGEYEVNIEVMYFTESPDGQTMAFFALSDTPKAHQVIRDAIDAGEFNEF